MSSHGKPSIEEPPFPWRRSDIFAVGGLFAVGYAPDTDLLLALSTGGRSIFDACRWEEVAHDDADPAHFFDPIRLTAEGFGPLAGIRVRVAGLFGGGLPVTTQDGWTLEERSPAWPTRSLYLLSPEGNFYDCIADDGEFDLRAYGYSETGLSFVVATSGDLIFFERAGNQ